MRLRLLALLPAAALGACASGTFIDDAAALRRRAEVVTLSDRNGDVCALVGPDLQGRVLTSTATASGGFSFGWLNWDHLSTGVLPPTAAPQGGEDAFFLEAGGPLEMGPFSLSREAPSGIMLRQRIHLRTPAGAAFEIEALRDIRLLAHNEPGRFLGVHPPVNVRWVAFESRNRITNVSGEEWKTDRPLPAIHIRGLFNAGPRSVGVVPFKEGPDDTLGAVPRELAAGRVRVTERILYFRTDPAAPATLRLPTRRSLGIAAFYDPDLGALTVVQTQPPAGPRHNGETVAAGGGPGGSFLLETSSPAPALRAGTALTHLHRTFHFQGSPEDLDVITRRVLGVGIEQIDRAFDAP